MMAVSSRETLLPCARPAEGYALKEPSAEGCEHQAAGGCGLVAAEWKPLPAEGYVLGLSPCGLPI